jgi:hypothetical protein
MSCATAASYLPNNASAKCVFDHGLTTIGFHLSNGWYGGVMPWQKIGDILPVHNSSTLIAGDAKVVACWPSAEAAGYPDDEYQLDSGNVIIFDLNLLQPVVFEQGGTLRLIASFGGQGSKNIDEATLASVLGHPASDQTCGTFEVTSGALVVANWDLAAPVVPVELPKGPTLVGKNMVLLPCPNGTYEVSAVTQVEAPAVTRKKLLQLAIRRAS